jgi:hypothetical protein
MSANYQPLQDYLQARAHADREISLSLDQIESIIGDPLPKSAYNYRQWWENQSDVSTRPQAKAWAGAGYKVESVQGTSTITAVRFIRR